MADWFSNFIAPYAEGLGISVAAILTLVVYSYLLGDNVLFRLAEHLFVGVAVAYAAVVAYHNVILPKVIVPMATAPQANLSLTVPLVLGLMLLAYVIPPLRRLSAIPLAFVTGVGAALAIGGAIAGSLLPQMQATMLPLSPQIGLHRLANNLTIVAGTICAFLYFYFTARQESLGGRLLQGLRSIGRWVIIISLGAIFGSLVMSRVSLLIGRVQFLLGDWLHLIR